MQNGLDCVDQIMDFYNKKNTINVNKLKIWLSNALIKLMKKMHKDRDLLNIRNCLLLLINLFFEDDGHADYLENKGLQTADLTGEERTVLCDILKKEFHLDYN